MKRLITILLVIIVAFTLTACKPGSGSDENVVYVTVYPIQFLTEAIAGDTVVVKRVPGSNVHSESIDWGAKEIIDMINADILFYIEGGVDTYIPKNKDDVFSDGDVQLISIADSVEYNMVCYSAHDHSDEEGSTAAEIILNCDDSMLSPDPHFWLDPIKMMEAAVVVKDNLIATYPHNETLYNDNFTALQSSLQTLHNSFQTMADFATKPIITTNMLFTYWHYRYEIEIMSLTTSIHNSETLPSDIITYVDEALANNVHYILFEQYSNSPAGDSVLQQLLLSDPTAQAAYLSGLGNLVQEDIDAGEDYLSMMYKNLEVLESATK